LSILKCNARVYFASIPDLASIPLRVYLLTSRVYLKTLEVYFMKHNLYSCTKWSIPTTTQVECQRAEDDKPAELKKAKKLKMQRDGVPCPRSAQRLAPSLPLPHAVQDLPASANTKLCAACISMCMWHVA
jgi:hypothetical protein